ncbi:MAG TPA: hypothetical protein VK192_02025 [Sphingomicrobium sp.]|jgi:hypothetical protein|nr:hypothetical protein [Sphingomicrobium sp.]
MHSTLITITIVVAVVLIHFSYVDFRFRYRGGMLWFWLLKPAPPLMWAARASLVVALLVTLSGPLVGTTKTYAFVVGAIMALHIISLILLEVLEPR